MVERGEQARLAFEPRTRARIGGNVCRQALDRNVTLEPRVAGEIHLTHAAGADERLDLVLTQPAPDQRRWLLRRKRPARPVRAPCVSRKPDASTACASSDSTSRRKSASWPHASARKALSLVRGKRQGGVIDLADTLPSVGGHAPRSPGSCGRARAEATTSRVSSRASRWRPRRRARRQSPPPSIPRRTASRRSGSAVHPPAPAHRAHRPSASRSWPRPTSMTWFRRNATCSPSPPAFLVRRDRAKSTRMRRIRRAATARKCARFCQRTRSTSTSRR